MATFLVRSAALIAGASPCLADDREVVARLAPREHASVSAPSQPESSPALRDLVPGVGYAPVVLPSAPLRAQTAASGGQAPALGMWPASTTAPTLLGTFGGIAGVSLGASPPDPIGAVGKTQYVQAVNLSFAVYDKSTKNLLAGPSSLNVLWASYTGTNPGNGCSIRNDGDPMVLYDKAADRWVIAQLSLPNPNTNGGPSFECVAVSKTGDATGAYWLYDFQYAAAVNDDPKLGVWPDAYYASFNLFSTNSFIGPEYCAYDRAQMLAGLAATQHCFLKSPTSLAGTPPDLDGAMLPPDGAPGYFLSLGDATSVTLWQLHVDWATPANSTLTSAAVTVPSYAQACGGAACITQPSPGGTINAQGDRIMVRVAYRNFGDHEALVANHTVTSGAVTGVRWYEIRSPGSTPVVTQAATFAPDNTLYRWNGSLAMDRKGDMALAYSTSNATNDPAIAFTGRLAGDTLNDMAGETTLFAGTGVQVSSGLYTPWGFHSSMTIDPVDDCTFWYTNEYYATSGYSTWKTRIGTLSFPGCAPVPTTLLLSTTCASTFTAGQPFSTSAAVTPDTATGSVDFGDGHGGASCSAVTLAAGVANCTTSSLATGTYSLGATYNGDSNDEPSNSNPLVVTVLSASDVIQRNGFEAIPNGCPAQ